MYDLSLSEQKCEFWLLKGFFLLNLQHPVSQTLADRTILTTKHIIERLHVNCQASGSKYNIVKLQPVLHCAVLQALYQWFCFWWDSVALNDRTT